MFIMEKLSSTFFFSYPFSFFPFCSILLSVFFLVGYKVKRTPEERIKVQTHYKKKMIGCNCFGVNFNNRHLTQCFFLFLRHSVQFNGSEKGKKAKWQVRV